MKRLWLVALLGCVLCGCGGGSERVSSNGGLYEIFVVCNDDKWQGELGDTMRHVLQQPIEMLNQSEPQFDVLQVGPAAFSNIIGRHRNLLFIRTGSEYKQASITAQYDVYAAPQIVLTLSGPTTGSIIRYVSDHRQELVQVLELAERNRALSAAARYNERTLGELVKDKFGIKIDIPKGYKLRAEGEDFIWISHERPQISQGFFIYSYPHAGREDFDREHLLERRNEFAARIPGPVEGSYMTTFSEDPDLAPIVRYVDIGGRHWARMSGFWDVHGDFMGGPFFTYSTVNHATNRVVALDCYLYSPKQPKRNFYYQLEHLVFSVSVP